MSKCPPKSFKYLSSQANAKDKLLEDGAINQTSVIIDLNKFKQKAAEFLNYVKKEFNIDATSVISGRLGETVNYNTEVFSKVDKIRGYDKINAKEIRKQLAELEEKPTEVKPGVSELFESNPELANQVYEALGFNELRKKYNQDLISGLWSRLAKQGVKNADSLIGTRETIDNVDFNKFWTNVTEQDLKSLINSYEIQKKEQLDDFRKYGSKENKFIPEKGIFISSDTSFFDNKIKDVQSLLQQKQQAQQLYSQYLDTIFPDSKVKDIVYRGGEGGISKEQYFTLQKEYAGRYGKITPAIINLTNPKVADRGIHRSWASQEITDQGLIGKDYPGSTSDAVIEQMNGEKPFSQKGNFDVIVTNKAEQVYELGSKQDIEGFKEFVKGQPAVEVKPEITKTDALKTFDFGSKEGTPQTKATDKAIHNNVINNPDKPMYDEGESFNEAFNRVIPEVSKLVDTVPANTVMVTHNSIFGLIRLWDKLGRPANFTKENRIEYTEQDNKFPTGSVMKIEGKNGTIYVVRHGETEDNLAKNYRRAEVNLTDKGREQAKEAGIELKNVPISQIIASPLPRTVETSNIILEQQAKPKEEKKELPKLGEQLTFFSKVKPSEPSAEFEELIQSEIPYKPINEIPKINKPEVISKLKEILDILGIKVTEDELQEDTAALADITNRLIKFSRGKLSEDNFTEEVFHFIVEILEQKNPELFEILMDKVRGFQVYQDILNPENGYITDPNYQNENGRPDYYKLKKEAIAKLLTQKVLGYSEESKEKETIFHRLWTMITDFIDSLFGSISPVKQDQFEEFIDKVLNTDYISKEDIAFLEGRTGEFAAKRKDIFKETKYKLGSLAKRKAKFRSNEEQRNHFESQRDLFTQQEDPDTKETFYIYEGKKKRRVTTLVKAAISKLVENFDKSEEKKLLREARMQKGTEVHKTIEDILYRYIDKTTGLLKDEPDSAPSSKLVSDKIYKKLEDHIEQRLSTYPKYPKGTRFSMELPIINEEEGYAGTADFVAFLPNMDVDILDWKTTGINYVMNNQLIERTDISPFNQKYWRTQTQLLKNAMKSQGTKNFRLTRAIPIITEIKEELINKKAKRTPDNVIFNVTSVEIGDVDVSKIKKSVLLPVSAETESTGIQELDEIINKLWAQYAKLEKTVYPEKEKYKKKIELNKLLKTIRDLQTKKSAESIQGVFDEQFRRIVRLEKETFDFLDEIQMNQRYLPDEQLAKINSYIQEVIEARGFLSIFKNFTPLVLSLYPEENLRTPEQKNILEELKKTTANKETILYNLDKKILSIYSKLGKLYDIPDINDPDNPRVGNSIIKNFLTLSERPENTLKFIAGVVNTLQSQEEEDKKQFQKKFDSVQKAFIEYAEKHGGTSKKNIKALYSKLVKKGKRVLISKIDDNEETGYYVNLANKALEMSDWWEKRETELKLNGLTGEFLQLQLEKEYKEKIESWLKENINLEKYQEIFKEKEEELKEFLENVKFDEDPFVNDEKKESYFYSWYNNHSILKSPFALNTDANWMIRNSDLASKKWESKEWKELNKPENKPLLDLYNLFEEVNEVANDQGMLDDIFASKRFLAKIKGDVSWFTDFLSWSNLNLKYLYLNFGNKLKSIFESDEREEYFEQKDPISGQRLRSIPVFYKYNTDEVLSDDLFYILNRWATHVYEFKAINKYENIAIGTELVEQLKEKQLNIGSKDNISPTYQTTTKEIDTLGDMRKFIDYYMYSKKYNEKKWYNKLGDLLYTYTALKYLGVHVSAISVAYLGGRWSSKLLATTNFSKEDYNESERLMTFGRLGNKIVPLEKVNAYMDLLREVNPNIHDINENKDESKSRMYDKRKFRNIALGGYSFVDNIIQDTMAVVFFKNTTVINGKFVNINKYVNQKYQDLYDKPIKQQIEIQNKIDQEIKELKEKKSLLQLATFEKGKLKIEGIDLNSIEGKSQMLQFKNLIRGYIKDAIGNASDKDISLARLNWWMKFIMQFKNWMPRVLGSRLKGFSYDTEKQEYTWGRTNLAWSAFWKLGMQTKLAHTITAITPFIFDIKESKLKIARNAGISTDYSLSLQDLAKEVYTSKVLLYEKNNMELDMTEKEFVDLYIKTYKASIQELNGYITIALIITLVALSAAGADDDDKWKYKIFLKILTGYQREQGTIMNPDSWLFITNTLIPVLGALQDIFDFSQDFVGKPISYIVSESDFLPDEWQEKAKKDIEKSHTLDKGIKTIPFLREAHFWMTVINPEINGEEYNKIMNVKTPQIK